MTRRRGRRERKITKEGGADIDDQDDEDDEDVKDDEDDEDEGTRRTTKETTKIRCRLSFCT